MIFKKSTIIFLFGLYICLIFPGAAFSVPNVSNVGGVVSEGQTVIIAGTDFGSHADYGGAGDYLCFQWDDFEGGDFSKWMVFKPEYWAITTDDNRPGSQYCAKRLAAGSSAIGKVPGSREEYFYSFYFRLEPGYTQSGSDQIKFLRLYSNYAVPRGAVSINMSYGSVRWSTDDGPTQYFFGSSNAITRGEWHKWEVYLKKSSTVSSNDGKILIWYDGIQKLNNHSYCTHGHSFETIMRVGEYNAGNYYLEFDDVYYDFTRARVEIGNASAWNNCTHREIQIPTAWSDTSITITVNQGSFANCASVYLFVVDADGNVNTAGYPIRIVTGAGEAPCPPIGLKIK